MTYAPAAAAVPWWLTGGISAANCIAAYQPKGAADYAASKVNLAKPGTYDAADGTAYPTWSAAAGWIAATTGYLTTGITVSTNTSWSFIARYAGATSD